MNNVNINKRIAILATHGFEEKELTFPMDALVKNGAEVKLISDETTIKSFKNKQWAKNFKVDLTLDEANADDFDALIVPGGVLNSDKIRRNIKAVALVKAFNEKGKYVAAICHGPQLLIEAAIVNQREVTGHSAIKTDLINAGAIYKEDKVWQQENLITAQGLGDVPAFTEKIAEALQQ